MFDEPRADHAVFCPFLRHQRGAAVLAPLPKPDPANACIASGDPRPQSLRQQELLCLHLAHADCPRYLRGGVGEAETDAAPSRLASRVPRATVAALLVLVLSAGLSFGFVLRRGGIELPSFAAPSAAAPTSATAAAMPGSPSASPDMTDEPSVAPSDAPTPAPSESLAPSPTPEVTPTPGPTATPVPIKTGSASRMKLVTACPGVADCYIYKVAAYGTVVDIAGFFGVSTKKIFAMNPGLNPRTIRHGQTIRIPTPTK